MPDPFLWLLYFLGVLVLVGPPLVWLVRRWIDWLDQRAELAPTYAPIGLPPARDDITQLLPVRFVGRARVVDGYSTLAEFAGASHKTAATIWAELDGVFTAKGMRTA